MQNFPKLATLVLTAAVLVAAGCTRRSYTRPDRPRLTANVKMQDVVFPSTSLERNVTYRAILPATISNGKRLPVVYLLHGSGGDFREWSNDSDVSYFAENGLILIMPEGESSYYTNSVDHPKDRFEDYIIKDLLTDVEARFPADRFRRAIAGVSMGGFGAIKLGLKYPELYRFVGALSPAIDVPSRPFSIKRISQYRHFQSIFGPWGSKTRSDNDPFVLVRQADPERIPFMFVTCGEQEGLLPSNRRFATLLAKERFHFEFHPGPGAHDWNQWNRLLAEMFASLEQHLGA